MASSVVLVLGGACSQQFGAAVAALLLSRVGALGVVTLRLVLAAGVLLLVCRPRLRGRRKADWAVVVAFGATLAGMNGLFYLAVARIPLGAAVTFEVLGPLTLSLITSRRIVSWLWAALALAGVALLGRGGLVHLDLTGVAFALGAATMWAAYILISAQTGRRFRRLDGLALAMGVGAAISLPLGFLGAGSALVRPSTLVIGGVVALLSSVSPYALELLALRRIAAPSFAVLMSLAPAIAVIAGFLVLHETVTVVEAVAILLVVVASAGAVRSASTSGRQ